MRPLLGVFKAVFGVVLVLRMQMWAAASLKLEVQLLVRPLTGMVRHMCSPQASYAP
jgi:hypothetical protein